MGLALGVTLWSSFLKALPSFPESLFPSAFAVEQHPFNSGFPFLTKERIGPFLAGGQGHAFTPSSPRVNLS